MTNDDIIRKVAKKINVTQKITKEIIDTFEEVIKETIVSEDCDSFKVIDIKFCIDEINEHFAKNISNGETVHIPKMKIVKLVKSASYKNIFKNNRGT